MIRGPLGSVGGDVLATVAKGRPLEAEELLMIAVLEQAVADLSDSSPEVREDASVYIFRSRDEGMFSFNSVCSYFKLSPTAVRGALRHRPRAKGRDRALQKAA